MGLVIAAISALSMMLFKFIAPGAMMNRLSDRNNFGRVALICPLTNLMMDFSFLLISVYSNSVSPYFAVDASFNGWIAMFNLVPFGVLDGQKIFDWNKIISRLAMTFAMGLFYLCLFVICLV